MNRNVQFDRDLEQWLEAEAPASAPAGFHALVMDRARTLRQRPAWRTNGTDRRFSRGRDMTLLAAAAAVLLVGGSLVVGSGVLRQQSMIPPATAPSPRVAMTSPSATSPSPSTSGKADASPTPAPITWTDASLSRDWPAAVRTEPAGAPVLVPIRWSKLGHVPDPTGDAGSAGTWADIIDVSISKAIVDIFFAPGQPGLHGVDPRQVRFGRGLVVDTDGDGVADWRYGMDNVPAGTPSHCDGSSYDYRWWRTDLHTGRTDWAVCYTLAVVGPGGGVQTAVGWGPNHLRLSFGSDTPAGEVGALPKGHFYAWASVIQDGQIVATDYAPDNGWLAPSP
jgi:hypothetical protein